MKIEKIDEILSQIVVRIDGQQHGTGFYIDKDIILTAYHVISKDIEKESNICIVHDTKYENIDNISIIDFDESIDIALLKTNRENNKNILPFNTNKINEGDKWRTYTCFEPLQGSDNNFEKEMIKGEVYQVENFNEKIYDIHLSSIFLKGEPFYGGYSGCSGSPICIDGQIVGVILKEEQSQRETPLKAISIYKIKEFLEKNNISLNKIEFELENQLNLSFESLFGVVISKDKLEEYNKLPSINLLYDQYNNTYIDMPTHISMRNDLVNTIIEEFKYNDILNIYGLVSSGKSILAGLISSKMNKYQLYIDLTWVNISNLDKYINDTIKSILESKSIYDDTEDIIEQICRLINTHGIMILDNLPLIRKNNKQYYFIKRLLETCKKYNMKVIIITSKDIRHLRYEMSSIKVQYNQSISFIKADIIEILDSYNLICNEKQLEFFYGVTKGDPSLVHSLFNYLSDNNWNFYERILEVINKEYASDIKDDLQFKIIDLIENQEIRELLYRLSLIDFPYTIEYIENVSMIEPRISFIGEKISQLYGWILKDKNLYLNMPLLEKLADENLNTDMIIKIHKVISDTLIKNNRVLNYSNFINIFSHLNKAKEYNSAALMLINVIQELINSDLEYDYWNILFIWNEAKIPTEIDIELVLYIRVLQIICADKFNIDTESYFNKLDKCIETIINENKQQHLIILGLICVKFYMKAPILALRYLEIIFNNIDSEMLEQLTNDLNQIKFEDILYMCCAKIKTSKERELFLKIYDELCENQLNNLNSSEFAYNTTLAFCSNICTNELDQENETRNWSRAIQELEYIELKAHKLKNKWLLINSIKIQIIIYSEYINRLDKAESIAIKVLESKLGKEKEIEFIIKEAIGRQFIYLKNFEKAKEYLDGIILDFSGFELEKIDYLTQYSVLNSNYDKKKSIINLLDASKIINQMNLSYEEHVKNIGELFIEYWLDKDYNNMYTTIKIYIDIMCNVDSINRDDKWKSLFLTLGHCTGYISSIFSTGKPPKETSDGDIYVEPRRGMFIHDDGKKASMYQSERSLLIYVHMADIAEFLGRYDDCKMYLNKFIEEYDKNDGMKGIGEIKLSSYLIKDNMDESFKLIIKAIQHIYIEESKLNNEFKIKLVCRNFIIPIIFEIIEKCISGNTNYKNDAEQLILLLKDNKDINSHFINHIEKLIKENIISNNFYVLKIDDNYEYYNDLKVIEYMALSKCYFEHDLLQVIKLQKAFIAYLEDIYVRDIYLFDNIIKRDLLSFWTYAYCNKRNLFNKTNEIDEKFHAFFTNIDKINLNDLLDLMRYGLE
ncbi:peptidase S1 and S6 chymotrypsin/Hap [[Clostridium] sordellii]|uniref:S1 family peptidase n=1 Tax=Paraclostridium sordellii TaxID=1505 RepID=UPI0005DD7CAC|nr:serine protease [Paeniclostridium sordellii]CEP95547.1 peptidase S1 and S6 chymotrypsin/Hap [[Clostridium] sordellii] [Paeniclostridium sordellii]